MIQIQSLQGLYEQCHNEQLKLQKEQSQLLEERKRLQADLQLCLEEIQQLQMQSPRKASLSKESASEDSQKSTVGSDSYQRSYGSDTASEENFLKSYNSTSSAVEAGEKGVRPVALQRSCESVHSSETSHKSYTSSNSEVEAVEPEVTEVTVDRANSGRLRKTGVLPSGGIPEASAPPSCCSSGKESRAAQGPLGARQSRGPGAFGVPSFLPYPPQHFEEVVAKVLIKLQGVQAMYELSQEEHTRLQERMAEHLCQQKLLKDELDACEKEFKECMECLEKPAHSDKSEVMVPHGTLGTGTKRDCTSMPSFSAPVGGGADPDSVLILVFSPHLSSWSRRTSADSQREDLAPCLVSVSSTKLEAYQGQA